METVYAQLVDEPEQIVLTRPDGNVYIYHTATLPLGYQYHLYRKQADEDNESRIQLTSDSVRPVTTENELRSTIPGLYWELRTRLTTATEGREMLYMLRNNREAGYLATFLYPELAKALGRLWIDESAETGREYIYTLEVLDEFGLPINESFDFRTITRPFTASQPIVTEVSNKGNYITFEWTFDAVTDLEDKAVLYFNIYQVANGEQIRMNQDVILRIDDDQYEYELRVPNLNETYTFTIVAVDVSAQQGTPGEYIEIEVLDNTEPDFLTNISGFLNDDGHAVITWPVATDFRAAGYHVYRTYSTEEDAELEQITDELLPVSQTSYTDSLIGTSGEFELWFYRVKVVSEAGIKSLPSNAAMIEIPVTTPPPPAKSLRAEVQDTVHVELEWEAPEMPERFTSWVIMRREIRDRRSEPFVRVHEENITGTHFTDSGPEGEGLKEGFAYEYRIASQDGDRRVSDFISTTVSIPKFTPPAAPASVQAVNHNGNRVIVNWSPSDDLFLDHYKLYRSESGEEPELLKRVEIPALRYRDEEVTPGTYYSYSVKAVDSFGNQSQLSVADSVFVRTFTLPRRVRNVRAEEAETGGVTVHWEPVPDDDLAGYRVFRSDIPTGVFEEVSDELITSTTFTDPDGKRNHWYIVRAYNSSTNESRPSEPAQAR